MKKTIGRITALTLLCGMLVSASACGGQPAPASPANPPQSAGSDPASSAPVSSGGGIGTPDNPVQVTYVCMDVNPDDEGIPEMVEAIEAGLAEEGKYIDLVVLEPPTGGHYSVALPLAYKTGQISPDIVYFQGGDQPVAEEGLLENLTPYIAGSTYVKALLQEHSAARVENYPYLLWLAPPKSSSVPVIRTDFLQQLDSAQVLLANPTPENYKKLMQEAVDKGLTRYGITNDGTLARMDSVFNHAFGVTTTLVKIDGTWVYTKTTEVEKNKLAYYADLYASGLLDPEYLTKKWDTMETAFYSGDSLLMAGSAGANINIYNKKMLQTNGASSQLTVLPPASGVSQAYQSVDVTKETRGFGINSQSKVKDAAWAVLEFMASPKGRMIDLLGVEGMHYNIVDGQVQFTEKFPEWWARFWETTYQFEPELPLAEPFFNEPATDSLDMIQTYYAADTNVLVPEDLAAQWDAMNMVYNEYAADIITGKKPIEAFDQFVAEWNNAGGSEFSEYLATVLP